MAQNIIENMSTIKHVFGLFTLVVAALILAGVKFDLFDDKRWEWKEFDIVSTPKKNALITSIIIAFIGIVLIITS
ncbi:hypothetical protein [Moritella sp. F3]|uniref:hypothetical protein n=1 Tax=Moritella sp. F3 TaxID=2718882 RepID=UPI0018E0F981|nr:hypothetical protein [Moritella sp. F3]GIC77150.1 hypothetical protein FMO001_18770 [Moritella sp. F1]GIC82269.1 hypothetical protein FMO003_25500 [Moritella sp. F3]